MILRKFALSNVVAIPNGAHRKNDVTEEDILTSNQSFLEFPGEDEEDFDDYAHRATSICTIMESDTSLWGHLINS